MQTSGNVCREIAKLYPPVIASEAKQSILRQKERKSGLLRCARNDVERAWYPLSPHPEMAAKVVRMAIPPWVPGPGRSWNPAPGTPHNRPVGLDFRQSNSPLVTES